MSDERPDQPQVDPALIYDTVARSRDYDLDGPPDDVFSRLPRRAPLQTIVRGERCPGCWIVCNSLNTEHLDACFYQGARALTLIEPEEGTHAC